MIDTSDMTADILHACFMAAATERPMAVPPLDLPGYVLALCRSWHSTHATPRVMRVAAGNFEKIGDLNAARFARAQAISEKGHDRLAARDLRALGLDGLQHRIFPANARAAVALFDGYAAETRPYGVFGYAYALEKFATLIPREVIGVVRALAPGIEAARCMRAHVTNDHGHVAKLVSFIGDLDRDSRLRVLEAVRETVPLIIDGLNDTAGRQAAETALAQRLEHAA